MDSTRKFSAAQKARADKRWSGDRPGNAETVPDGYRGNAETMPGEYPNDASHSLSQTPQPKPQPQPQPKRTDTAARLSARSDEKHDFESFKVIYPKRSGSQLWSGAIRAANARIKEGATVQDMIDGTYRYAAYCNAIDKTGTQYVMQALTFLGPGKHFLEPWDPPPGKSEALEKRNRRHAIDFIKDHEP